MIFTEEEMNTFMDAFRLHNDSDGWIVMEALFESYLKKLKERRD